MEEDTGQERPVEEVLMDDREPHLKIEAIEAAIPMLQQQARRMQEILSSEFSAKIKTQARGHLAKAIKDLARATEEISRLRANP